MDEKLLHQIWNLQYFNKVDLSTTCGKKLYISFKGNHNQNAGPDFLDARISIADTHWAGNVEIHIRTSDWYRHKHQYDPLYLNVILHVVWVNDMDTFLQSPVLTLQDKCNHMETNMLNKTISLGQTIACSPFLKKNHFTSGVQKKLLKLRLEKKCREIKMLHQKSNFDWEQVYWVLLCRNMGRSVNVEAFEKIAHNIPYKIIKKYFHDTLSVEALLFGAAGFLNDYYSDDYPNQLKLRFAQLKILHKLDSNKVQLIFLRMRPMNFPTIRLAQLSALLTYNKLRIRELFDSHQISEIKGYFKCELNQYWTEHYLFDRPSPHVLKHIGEKMMTNIIVNTIIPLKLARATKFDSENVMELAISMLNMLEPESNNIIQKYQKIGLVFEAASESQACIELYSTFCSKEQCKNCMVAQEISKNI